MKLTTAACVIVISLAMIGRASGGWLDGNQLYAKCTSSSPVEQALCTGYIQGVFDAGDGAWTMLRIWQQQGVKLSPEVTISEFRWCAPERMTAGQATDVVTQFLRSMPDVRHA